MLFIETDRGLISSRYIVRMEQDTQETWSIYYFDGSQLEVARARTQAVEDLRQFLSTRL